MTRLLVAPDSFKGTFSAVEVAEAVGRGAARAGATVDLCPVADGGEGTMAVLGGRAVSVRVHDPLGRVIDAAYSMLDDGRAVVEMAAASGLGLLAADELDPWAASTFGTGELIRAAVEAGASEVLVAVGGSATVDGGRGALEALDDVVVPSIVVLCDVETPWERSAEVFGPQKGADPEMVRRLASRLDAYAAELPRDPRGVPMTGAAGGLSGGLWAGLGASLVPGAPYVLDALGFDERLRAADAVIAGEGKLDAQSLMGKVVGEIASRAAAAGVPVHAIVGVDALGAESRLASVTEATTLAEIEAAAELLGENLGA
jgi:glycerate kinase